jgi:hypothetical protein
MIDQDISGGDAEQRFIAGLPALAWREQLHRNIGALHVNQ